MTVLPIIARELRVAGRQGRTYWLRLAAGVLLLAGMGGWGFESSPWSDGLYPFATLHYGVFLVLWLFVPLMTADCLSRERREGTLGLLFLTPLSAQDVVTAKVMTNALKAFTLWLAAVPMMTVPLLMGGLGAIQVLASVALNFAVLLLALTAGLVASALMTRWTAAIIAALLLAVYGFVALLGGMIWGVVIVEDDVRFSVGEFLEAAFELAVGGPRTWATVFQELGSTRRSPLTAAVVGALWAATTLSILGFAFAVRHLRRTWRTVEKPRAVVRAERALTTPIVATAYFRRWQRRLLECNPVCWLQRRSWTGRMLAWAWLGLAAVLASSMALHGRMWPYSAPTLLSAGWLVAAGIGVTAAASFVGEKHTGFLELLLATPLNGRQILWGRLRGIWGQFWPAVAVLLVVWFYLDGLFTLDWWEPMALIPAFVTLPVIGLYFSLRCRTVTAAIAATLVVGIVLPWFFLAVIMAAAVWWRGDSVWVLFGLRSAGFPGFSQPLRYDHQYYMLLSVVTAVFQAGVAAMALKRSLRLLNTRTLASVRQ